ncbi:MAG TPA: serine hydrolase domain-containing protein, partial [Amphiplicatus sp.]|nr:serine hydrolase domain-containing protein [Amphiplicatus sp.]
MFLKAVKTAALVLALAACTNEPASSKPAGGEKSALHQLIADAQKNAPYPALAVSVRKGDKVIFEEAVGDADLEQLTKASPDTVFAVGSITKSFTSIAIAQLAVKGEINLDAPVSTYLTDYDGPAKDAPVWTLMNHTSGLVNYTALPGFPRGTRQSFTRQQMVDMFEHQNLMFEPGDAFSYSNSGTFLLGLIIERVSGKTYEEYLQENVLDPLHLSRTFYNHPEKVIPGRAEGYKLTEHGFDNAPLLDPQIPFSAGALASTVQDIQKYLDEVHRKNALGDDIRNILYTQKPFNDGEVNSYALGALGIREFEGRRKIAHAGDIDGFSGYMAYYPDEDVSIVVLANTRDVAPSAVGLEQKVARLVFNSPRPAPTKEALSAEEIAMLVGDYKVGRMRIGI